MELTVYNRDGSEAGRRVTLEPSVFGVEPNEHVVWLDVRRIQANARQGTHKTKERGEVAGSTRKLYRQKGTGYARAGSARSPIRKSGGRTHGPRPRTYTLKLSKKTRRLARRSVLASKAQGEQVRVIENFSLEAPSTKELVALLEALDLQGRKVLLLTAKLEDAIYRSSRNVPKLHVQEARSASTLELLSAQMLVVQEGALDVLASQLGTGVRGDGSPAPPSAEPEPAAPPEDAPASEPSEPASPASETGTAE